ncbi:RNA polymerase sigma-54 factor 1 [Swaminathania salitolerans]|uniref:RNA polymerase sigma-54 factor n=2 Tax=Swaminathania salitolerans TaxID=182838 RepID=A0A511BN17_9PROT|nr:RNA polymerase sigma-54 factor 1 [Swaminathania salitolerans]
MSARLRQAVSLLAQSNQELLGTLTALAETNPLLIVTPPSLDPSSYPAPFPSPFPAPPERRDAQSREETGEYEDGALPGPDARSHGRADTVPDAEGRASGVAPSAPSLEAVMAGQIALAFSDSDDRRIALALLSALDESGRLSSPPAALAAECGASGERLDAIRRIMMQFDPVGCFALTLEECLAAQFREKNRYDPAVSCLLAHLDWLAKGEHLRLRKACQLDAGDYADLLAELRRCTPRPGAAFTPEPQTILPDLHVFPRDGRLVVRLDPRSWPRLEIDGALYARLLQGNDVDRGYAREKKEEAEATLHAVEQRARSILLVGGAIVRHQARFLQDGESELRRLTLRDVAERTGLHESTVSRLTATRFIGTPRGVLPLRRFFSSAPGQGHAPAVAVPDRDSNDAHDPGASPGESRRSAEDGTNETRLGAAAIQARIRRLILNETPENILSDEDVTRTLQASGIAIQRRTVAKYREALGIPGSARRRRDRKGLAG